MVAQQKTFASVNSKYVARILLYTLLYPNLLNRKTEDKNYTGKYTIYILPEEFLRNRYMPILLPVYMLSHETSDCSYLIHYY
jgi:hypothetical protein